ncbi:MAG: 4a-hydroxytetrahydrobiopterin dehydratase [Bacteroidales bacterium]
MKTFSKEEVTRYLELNLEGWTLGDTGIKREFKFANFVQAFSFMTSVALEAEKINHHPDWSNSYNRVSIVLMTHSAGGITENDLNLANSVESAYKKCHSS